MLQKQSVSIINIVIKKYKYKNIVWVDLISPTPDEVREIMEKYRISPNVAEELLVPSLKPKVDLHRDYIYLILHFPAIRHSHKEDPNQEVDFILGKKFIITAHYDTIDPLHKFSKIFEVSTILEKEMGADHAGHIFYHMIKKLYKSLGHELDFISDQLKRTESKMFSDQEKKIVYELSLSSRDLIQFKNPLRLHSEVLHSLEPAVKKIYGDDYEYYFRSIEGAFTRVKNLLDTNMDIMYDLRKTNDALLSSKQNEIMQKLTVISFITFPLSVIAGIFGLSSNYVPLMDKPSGFYTVIGIMALISITMYLAFKKKGWF